jgi:hypothetical protein
MNGTSTVKLVCGDEYITLGRTNGARPKERWTNTVDGEQAMNGLYFAAVADYHDTSFSYVTVSSVPSTMLLYTS